MTEWLAHAIARDYWIPGADRDDVHQEAMIALWHAKTDWDEERGPFVPFARLVIQRHLQSKVRDAKRVKHMVLTLANRDTLPAAALEDDSRHELQTIIDALKVLTPRQRQALADALNERPQDKQTSNAAYHARRKLRTAA